MRDFRLNQLLWALALVAAGLLMLGFNFDLWDANRPQLRYAVAGALALVAVAFFVAFLTARHHWWRLAPAWSLLALAAMVALSTLGNTPPVVLGGMLFAGLSAAFAHIYLLNRAERWWAILPSGFMLVLGVVVALSQQASLAVLGALLFGGIGAVFGLLYLLGERRRHWWALAPSFILVAFALFVLTSDARTGLLRWWPLLLVGAGLWVGRQAARRQAPEPLVVNATAATITRREEPVQTAGRVGVLGDYVAPAPGASIEILPDED